MSRMIKLVLAGALLLALTAGMAAAQSAEAIQECGEFTGQAAKKCNGSPGDDQIFESGTFLTPNQGNDNIFGKGGDDYMDASARGGDQDKLNGAKGDDTLDAREGEGGGPDVLDCGPGVDEYAADEEDEVKSNCEIDLTGL